MAGCAVAVWFAVLVLFCLWRPAGVPVAELFSLVLGAASAVYIGWVSARCCRLVRQALAEAAVHKESLAVEQHGGLSPQARAAAAKITRHPAR